uniref:Uncharacterized protein n=1 Tax=Romanomermis culicivorax TaxID=13658 RepID=A0A915K7E1_ROMCU
MESGIGPYSWEILSKNLNTVLNKSEYDKDLKVCNVQCQCIWSRDAASLLVGNNINDVKEI